jgi:asparagine synthase (glutamine-hydrolysing)
MVNPELGDILVKVDRASMMNSLEIRSSFLDKSLAEFVLKLPPNLRMRGMNRKYLLKESYHGLLPDKIINRRKKGFGIPVSSWLREPLHQMVKENLSKKRIEREGVFDYHTLESIINSHMSNKADRRKELWLIFIFQLWSKYHNIL